MAIFEHFSTATPTHPGWYWMQNTTTMNDPVIVLVRQIDLTDDRSGLGYQLFSGSAVTPMTSVNASLMQWQEATWQ